MIPSLLCDSYEVWPISLLLIYRWVKAFHLTQHLYRHYCMIAMRSDLYIILLIYTHRGRAGSTGGSPPWCSASSPPGCCASLIIIIVIIITIFIIVEAMDWRHRSIARPIDWLNWLDLQVHDDAGGESSQVKAFTWRASLPSLLYDMIAMRSDIY